VPKSIAPQTFRPAQAPPTEVVDGQRSYYWPAVLEALDSCSSGLPPLELPPKLRVDFVYLLFHSQVFGWGCGVMGVPPRERLAALRLCRHREVLAMRYLLRHASPVGRLYAAESLILMGGWGQALEENDLDIIVDLYMQKEKVMSCNGCIHSARRPEQLLNIDSLADLQRMWSWADDLGWTRLEPQQLVFASHFG
jgi:hypothetical protein